VASSSLPLDAGHCLRSVHCSRLLDLRRIGESSRLSSVGASWEWIKVTPDGPEMKMLILMEENLHHLVDLRLAACELQATTHHELNVYSLRSCAAVNECLTQCAVKLRC
jgi:hypothetical protein